MKVYITLLIKITSIIAVEARKYIYLTFQLQNLLFLKLFHTKKISYYDPLLMMFIFLLRWQFKKF